MLACCGIGRQETADCLDISARTVDSHRAEIYRSLGSEKHSVLLGIAIEIGLFTLEDLLFFSQKFEVKPKVNRGIKTKKVKKKKKAA